MRRVLLITYYYPPSGGPGVQRMLKFSRYLPEFGWRPTVLTVHPDHAAYPEIDESLLEEVPSSLRVERTRAWDPYAIYARMMGRTREESVTTAQGSGAASSWKEWLARWIRANVFLPDARVGWVPFAVARGRRLLAETRYDAIMTSGPPHSTHLAGLALSRLSGVPWVADFRDPWSGLFYTETLPATPPAEWIDGVLERLVLRSADRVLGVTPMWTRQLAEDAGTPGTDRFRVLRNGFDPADFQGAVPPVRQDRFILGYAGSMAAVRNPTALWDALERLERDGRCPKLQVRLTGSIDPAIQQHVERRGLGDRVVIEGYVSHGEAVRRMRESAALLLMISRQADLRGVVPGKLYEYLAAGRPVLGLGPQGESARLLSETGAGRIFDFDDEGGVAVWLEEQYAAWSQDEPIWGADAEVAARYSRRTQSGELARLFEEVAR